MPKTIPVPRRNSMRTGVLPKNTKPPEQPRSAAHGLAQFAFAVSAIGLAASSAAAFALWWGYVQASPEVESNHSAHHSVHHVATKAVHREPKGAGTCFKEMLKEAASSGHSDDPYKFATGTAAHKLPPMYGDISERTIWVFWYDAESCPFSTRCNLPPYLQLCLETIRKHQGSFNLQLVHADTVGQYVSMTELPTHWSVLGRNQQRDALMNALLARYGGIALDISTILFRPLDDYWDELVNGHGTFRGYMYRLNGRPWHLPETTSSWFLMSRREGIFGTAVRDQRTSVCSLSTHLGMNLGDRTLAPILNMLNYTLPKCYEDAAVPLSERSACPEFAQPNWTAGVAGLALTDRRVLLADPRDGPELPFARSDEHGLTLWHVSNASKFREEGGECDSMKECWDTVFLPRFRAKLPFVRIFDPRGRLRHMSLQGLLANDSTYFYRWLRLARLSERDLAMMGGLVI